MTKSITEWLSFGYGGVLNLSAPIVIFGEGNPKLAITCSVHGDEHAGVVIASRLIEILKSIPIRGTIAIILSGNPAAQFLNQRISPQDLKDLNRMGTGRKDGSFTERLAHTLFEYLKEYDFVVNIHEFEMNTPVTAVFMNTGSEVVQDKIIAGISAFAPDITWYIEYSANSDDEYSATLDTALARAGVPNFPIETTQLSYLSDGVVNEVAIGLLRLAKHLDILNQSEIPSFTPRRINAFYRQEITAEIFGIWKPNEINVPRDVKEGDAIGILQSLPEFDEIQVLSPVSGKLIQVRHRQLVSTGTSLFSVGLSRDIKGV